MTDRYEAVAARKYTANGEERTAFTNIGVAFRMRDRDGYSLKLHAVPAPQDGEYHILLFPPKPREDRSQSGYGRSTERQQMESGYPASSFGGGPSGGVSGHLDDDIPF